MLSQTWRPLVRFGLITTVLAAALARPVISAAPTATSTTPAATPAPAPTERIIAADGTGEFRTVQAAINAAVASGAPALFRLKAGRYFEKITVPAHAPAITLVGDVARPESVVLAFDDFADRILADGRKLGTSPSASVRIDAADFAAEGITFENTHGPGS